MSIFAFVSISDKGEISFLKQLSYEQLHRANFVVQLCDDKYFVAKNRYGTNGREITAEGALTLAIDHALVATEKMTRDEFFAKWGFE